MDIIKKTLTDFDVTEETVTSIIIHGAFTAASAQKINMRPEGQRSWKWWTLWTREDLTLDWILRDSDGKLYRVVERTDWRVAGFSEYLLAETAA